MESWKASLHGGHSGEYCDHAEGTLRELLDAAAAFGYHTFGVSEHAPRVGAQYLYDKEKELGWTVEKIADDFARYTLALPALVEEYADRLSVLRGFEAEIVPPDEYVTLMRGIRNRKLPDGRPAFDYFVGSVHFINDVSIDGPPALFAQAVASCGGLEELAVEYYRQVGAMAQTLRPDVVGHFDLIKLNALQEKAGDVYDPAIMRRPAVLAAAQTALEAVRDNHCILDLNTAGWRKGLGEPYPGPGLVHAAHRMGVPFCFGDDSHRVSQVGAGIADARRYLLGLGVPTLTVLTRETNMGESPLDSPVVRRVVPL